MRPSQDTDAKEGPEPDLLNERLGSGKIDVGDAYHPEPANEATMVVTREIHDKGASAVQHVRC